MLINKVKVALRTMTDDEGINEQVQGLIDASILDLQKSGIAVEMKSGDVTDKNVELAIVYYCKGYFYSNETFLNIYNSIKTQLGVWNG